MDRLNAIIDSVNAFAWGPPMLGILGVTGLLLTLGLVFMPWRKVGYGFRLLFDKSGAAGEGEVKPFNALMTAL
ncbi:MAG: sodium:alanine symporter family protein, partial [Deltaproteobacteria bacterium]|nr:sodium:alanine symporter family protein [Deltaproteobacteria bacterium]